MTPERLKKIEGRACGDCGSKSCSDVLELSLSLRETNGLLEEADEILSLWYGWDDNGEGEPPTGETEHFHGRFDAHMKGQPMKPNVAMELNRRRSG